jgi:hypothetical protein
MHPFKPFPLLNGKILAGARPKRSEIQILKTKIHKIVTLLWETEDPHLIHQDCDSNEISWDWVPIKAINWETYSDLENKSRIFKGLKETLSDLSEGRSVLIHCAAGIHRTGFFVYNLLRMSGFEVSEATESFKAFRPEILRKFGRLRFEVAENFFRNSEDFKVFTPFYKTLNLFQSDFISKRQDFLLWVKVFQNGILVKVQFSATARDFSKIVVGGEVFLETLKRYTWQRHFAVDGVYDEIMKRTAEEVQKVLMSFVFTSQFKSKIYLAGFDSELDRQFIRDHFPELDDLLQENPKYSKRSKYEKKLKNDEKTETNASEKFHSNESIYEDIKTILEY